MSYGISSNGLPCVITPARMGHHSVAERCKTGSASDLVEVESHDFNRGSVSRRRVSTMQSCRDSRSSTKRLTELPLKGTGKTLLLTAARTRRKKFEYQPLRTLQGALLAENHKQATETQYHRNRSLQRDAGHTSHHHEKK